MFLSIIPLAALWLLPILTRLVAEGVAIAIGIGLVMRDRCAARAILPAHARHTSDFDRKQNRAGRRSLAAALRSSMRCTQWRSLFPHVMSRAETIVEASGR